MLKMSIHPLLLLLLFVDPTRAFSVETKAPQQTATPPPFRQVLAEAGKKIFRPGGSAATEKLHGWARNIGSSSRAVEFATGPGTGMDLVAKTGCRLLVTDPFEETLETAKETARQRGLLDRCDFQKVPFMGDSLDWAREQPRSDVAIVEAVLTKYPRETKQQILKRLHDDVADQLLLHEICIRGCEEDEGPCAAGVKETVGSALAATGYNPLTTEGWIRALEDSGFRITDIETGPIQLIKPASVVHDEGLLGAIQIGLNLATHEDLRERFWRTREVLEDYENEIGYLIVHAVATKK